MSPPQRIAVRETGPFFLLYTRIPVGRVVYTDVVRGMGVTQSLLRVKCNFRIKFLLLLATQSCFLIF